MNCVVCGTREGEGQCGECRALALEIAANAEALGELRFDEIRIPRRRSVYPWLGVAAAALLAFGLPQLWRHPRVEAPAAPTEILTIKMLTPDPTVVIYWLADAKKENR